RRCCRLNGRAQNFLHRLALGELVDELVEITNLAHQGLLDVFDTDAADDASDERPGRIEPRFPEERLEVGLRREPRFELLLIVAREPTNDLVDLGLRTPLLLGLRYVERIHAREADPV